MNKQIGLFAILLVNIVSCIDKELPELSLARAELPIESLYSAQHSESIVIEIPDVGFEINGRVDAF